MTRKPWVTPERAEKIWRRSLHLLRVEHPPGAPVFVSRRPLKDAWATCYYMPVRHRLVITVDPRVEDINIMLQLLVHEWAHAVSWFDEGTAPGRDHGPAWGVAHAACYTTVFDT